MKKEELIFGIGIFVFYLICGIIEAL